MPKNKNAKHALTYNSLYDFEKGYADALLRYFSNRDDAEAWSGIGVENLAPETVEVIRRDCRSFVVNMIESAVDENGSMEVVEGLYNYDLGRHLFLERMETGVGFGDLASVDDELRAQLIDAAGDLKPFEAEIGDGGQIHVRRQNRPTFAFEVSEEDKELLESMRSRGFRIFFDLDPDSGGLVIHKGAMSAEWLFVSDISLSDGRTMSDAKSALVALLDPASAHPAP